MNSIWAKLLLAACAGALLAGSLPPVGWRPFAVIGIGVLLWLLRGADRRTATRAGFVFGFVAFGCAFSWLPGIFGWLSLALIGVHALFTALFGACHAAIARRGWSIWSQAFATGTLWTAIEFVRAEHFWLDFPWLTIGHGLGVQPYVTAPLLAVTGVYGVGWVVVVLLSALVHRMRDASPHMKCALAGAAIVLPGLGLLPAAAVSDAAGPQWRVAALQTFDSRLHSIGEKVSRLPRVEEEGPLIVALPEEAFPFNIEVDARQWAALRKVATESGATFVFGTQQDAPSGGWHNTALTVDANGVLGRHFKNHPVHLFNDGTPGATAEPVVVAGKKIGTPVCFDCDYEGVVRRMTAAGAEAFVVPSLDPNEWTIRQHWQHARLFQVRAAENHRAMLVCSADGITQLIGPDGGVRNHLPPGKEAVLSGSLPLHNDLTFYVRAGWLFPWCALVAGGLLIGWCAIKSQPLPINPPTAAAPPSGVR